MRRGAIDAEGRRRRAHPCRTVAAQPGSAGPVLPLPHRSAPSGAGARAERVRPGVVQASTNHAAVSADVCCMPICMMRNGMA